MKSYALRNMNGDVVYFANEGKLKKLFNFNKILLKFDYLNLIKYFKFSNWRIKEDKVA